MPRHDIRGRIAYLDLDRHETGSAWFSVSRYPDGSRTARCECHFDDVGLVRDVTLTLGAGWFCFAADEISCDSLDAEGRPRHHRRAYHGPVPAFGAHPILNDGFWTALFDLSRPDEVQRLAGSITYSKEMIGNERIGIQTFDLDVRYLGEEDVSVPAGTFHCRAFSAQILGLEAPFRLWTWSDDYIIVRETWAQMPATFELAELQVR